MLQLSNQYLNAQFKLKGAELCSLTNGAGTEFIWEGNPNIWSRHAPVLFPIVGKLNNHSYRVSGKTYQLGQHGFARDLAFEVVEHSSNRLVFQLESTAETLKQYPYRFLFQISYTLTERELAIAYRVSNINSHSMYFSIGAHPGFTCPLHSHEDRADYRLEFSEIENASRHLLTDGAYNGNTRSVLAQTNTLAITKTLFDEDALVFKNLKSSAISLIAGDDQKVLTVHFKNFPYLGIWSKDQDAPFVCIEPWYGLADNEGFDGDISEKEGIQHLQAGEIFECSHAIYVHQS